MKIEFLIILIIRIIFGVFIFIIGFLLGTILEKRRYQKKVAEFFDEVIDEMNRIRKEKPKPNPKLRSYIGRKNE